jgi:hypothetical protein
MNDDDAPAVDDFRFSDDPSIDNYKMPYKQNLVDLVMNLYREYEDE